jgi:arylsulfatase
LNEDITMQHLSRRQFLGQAANAALVTAMAQAGSAARPNVLFIMTDQQRADALGAAGNTVIRTPHLDALAKDGVLFRHCWVQHPVCMPSRASIFTGRYPSAHRVRTNGVALPPYETTLAQTFLENGYRTGGAGKFHFVPHLNRQLPTMDTHPGPFYGFQEFHIGEDDRTGEYGLWLKRYHPEYAGKRDHELPVEVHHTSWTASHTIDFIKKCGGRGEPFFAFCSFVDPHQGYDPPPPYRTMYKEADMPAAISRPGELDDKPPFFKSFAKQWQSVTDRWRYHRTQYYGEVTFIDDAVGRIVAALEGLRIRENTLVLFTSDHGDMLGDHGLFFKGPFHYRGCTNVPLLFHWPGHLRAGKRVDGMVQEIDLFPTITALLGLTNPPGVQGKSQKPVLTTDSTDTGYESALIEFGTSGATVPNLVRPDAETPDLYTIRSAKWRMSYYPGKEYGELYDLENDPHEFINRWNDPSMQATKRRLKDELLDRVLAAHDPLPVREELY